MNASTAETLLYLMMAAGIVSVLAVAAVFVLFLKKVITGINAPEYVDALAQYDRNFQCPRCGTAMESGFSFAPRGIQWRGATETPPGRFTIVQKVIPNTANWGFTIRDNKAWRCRACSLLVVDHTSFLRHGKERR